MGTKLKTVSFEGVTFSTYLNTYVLLLFYYYFLKRLERFCVNRIDPLHFISNTKAKEENVREARRVVEDEIIAICARLVK